MYLLRDSGTETRRLVPESGAKAVLEWPSRAARRVLLRGMAFGILAASGHIGTSQFSDERLGDFSTAETLTGIGPGPISTRSFMS